MWLTFPSVQHFCGDSTRVLMLQTLIGLKPFAATVVKDLETSRPTARRNEMMDLSWEKRGGISKALLTQTPNKTMVTLDCSRGKCSHGVA